MTQKQAICAVLCYLCSAFFSITVAKNNDLFNDFASALDKITSVQTFATHFLAIVNGLDESNASLQNAINTLFRDRMTFITSESLLSKYDDQDKKNYPAPKAYVFLKPPSLESTFPFILCIPKENITTAQFITPTYTASKAFDEHEKPKLASLLEKKLGLFVEHLTEKDYAEGLLWSNCFGKDLSLSQLHQFLLFLFIPNDLYEKSETPPRWVLYFDGHGGPYTPYCDQNIVNLKSFIKDQGIIANFPVNVFTNLLKELAKKITISLLRITTCFGGGINIGDLFKDILSFCPFFITTSSLTGETCVLPNTMIAKNKETLQPYAIETAASPKDFFSILKNATQKTINTLLPQALAKMNPQHSSIASKTSAIKPFEATYFIDPAYPHLIRLDQETIKKYLDQKKSVGVNPSPKKDTPVPTVILLYANTIPLSIDLENASPYDLRDLIIRPDFYGRQISLTSAIPGATFHLIKEIKPYKDSLWNYRFRREYPEFVEALFPDIDTADNRSEPKLFHIQKISGLINQSSKKELYELWISFDPLHTNQNHSIEILLCAKEVSPNTSEPLYFITKTNKLSALDKTEALDKESAVQWQEKFEERIEMLKKIAKYQAPYRLLKDADIEILDQD
ncbi:MAG: hypothetical protein UV38_C0002G0145 [candidate division TM6 bacterium GW2011_GWE2_42_60]|nr:MAG: hypothetical protein UV38_C0002G0145 [candidate division TM6 bacterium GW2011_GWE2_42_60]HBY06098.1 hypothetical protein [Candidatus Dependentiae bacterium]